MDYNVGSAVCGWWAMSVLCGWWIDGRCSGVKRLTLMFSGDVCSKGKGNIGEVV